MNPGIPIALAAAMLAPVPAAALAPSSRVAPIDVGPVTVRVPDGAAVEIRHRDAVGALLSTDRSRPRGTVTSTVVFRRGCDGCAGRGGDARAVPSVGWSPALPWAFAIEAGPPRIRVRAPVPPPGAGADFTRVRSTRGAWVSDPGRVELAGGGRALALCDHGTCLVEVPLAVGVRAWFRTDGPRGMGGAALAVSEFGLWALGGGGTGGRPPARRRPGAGGRRQ